MFSIIVENIRAPYYFTEKLIDCLLTGCIPIYWGAPNIGKYFNLDGFVIFNSYEELARAKLSKTIYSQKIKAAQQNYELAKQYISSDDYLAEKLSKLI